MKRRLAGTVLLIYISLSTYSCGGNIINRSFIGTVGGEKVYSIEASYGGLNGTKKQAESGLDHESRKVCQGDYRVTDTNEYPGLTRWGMKNNLTHLTWKIRCDPTTNE